MQNLKSRLQEKKEAIVKRWLDHTLATYSGEASSFLGRSKDPFANPVGHALRTGTRALFDSLLDGMEPEETCRQLDEILRIRAVQDFSPSQAISFIFALKKAIREEVGAEIAERRLWGEWSEVEDGIDQMALYAFDVLMRCRERVYELRVNEVKRSVSALMRRYGGDDLGPESIPEGPSPWIPRGGSDR